MLFIAYVQKEHLWHCCVLQLTAPSTNGDTRRSVASVLPQLKRAGTIGLVFNWER